jgi:hypothetical protein
MELSTHQQRSLLLRSRFDHPAQLQHHLHVRDARAGYLWFAGGGDAHAGDRVALEVSFGALSQLCILHGRVRLAEEQGLWLEVPVAGHIVRWAPGVGLPHRRHDRVAVDLLAHVTPPAGAGFLCRVLDLGEGGLRLGAGLYEAGDTGGSLTVRLLPPEGQPVRFSARVAWSGAAEAGVAIESIGGEDLLGLLDLIDHSREAWLQAPVAAHLAACGCTRKEPALEPKLPALLAGTEPR